MDTYRFTRRGYRGVFTVDAESIDDARQRATEFLRAVLRDFTWKKTIYIESCMGSEDLPEVSDEDVAQLMDIASQ